MPNAYRLDILRQLREAVGLTQSDMARLCGLHGRQSHQTAGAWERGTVTPTAARRTRFMGYLWDALRLREDVARFEEIWALLVEEWQWEPISDREWHAFTRQARARAVQSSALHAADPEKKDTATERSTERDAGGVDNLPLDTVPEPGALPSGSKMPLARNPLFVGRQSDLRGIASALAAEQTVAVTGLGGIGKTQLASEFVHRYGRFFGGGVFWLSFEEATTVPAEVASCGGPGSMELRQDFASRSLDEQVQLVRAAWQEPVARLLVFDNCEDPELLVRWRPTSGGCRLLLTSRRHDWELALGVDAHALAVLERRESLKLLRRDERPAKSETQDSATLDATTFDATTFDAAALDAAALDAATLDAIAAELGDLPLALHLAASYLHRYRRVITPEQYLAQLHDPNLLDHPSLQGRGISPTGHIQHIGRTFALSYDQLDAADAVDAQALALMACLALMAPGEPVPYALPAQTFGLDLTDASQAATLEDSIMRLAELGLIDVHDNRQLRIHRLLAAFVRAGDPALCSRVQAQLERVIQRKLDENYLDANYQMNSALNLLPIQAHLRQVVENALAREDAQSATLSHALARYWWQLGSFAEAEHYATRGLTIRQALYGESHNGVHGDIAISHHLLGILCQRNHSFEQAHHHFQSALEMQLALGGELHFNTADILVNMAELHWAQQHIPEAIACLERGLAICDETVEEDHPLVAQLTMTLALCLHDGRRDPRQARYYMEEALRIRRHAFGEAHPYTATVYMNMGYLLRESGEFDEADKYYRRGLAIRQQTLGEKHVETAHALFSLGKLRRVQERLEAAQECMEQALAILLADQGEMYYLVASCRHELGAILLSQGDPARARRYFEEALAVRRAIYRDDHPHVVSTRQALQQAMEAENAGKNAGR